MLLLRNLLRGEMMNAGPAESTQKIRIAARQGRIRLYPTLSNPYPVYLLYCDEKVANRDVRVWHFVIENGY